MTMHKALHPRDDIDRIYASRKEGGCVDASIQRIEDYIQKRDDGLITAIWNVTGNTMDNRMTITRGKNWKESNFMGVLND